MDRHEREGTIDAQEYKEGLHAVLQEAYPQP